jgi:O-antigen ligase
LFLALLALVLIAPLPFGANRPWAWSSLAVLVGLLLIAWGLAAFRGRVAISLNPRHYLWIALPMGASLAWALVQGFAPVPAAWAHPLWDEAGRALGQPVAGRISLDPTATGTVLTRSLAYLGVFWLAMHLGRDRDLARLGVVALAWGGTVYALYGLVLHMLGIERILWFDKWAYVGDLTSTFVNRNSYGAYAGLGLVCAIGLVIHAFRRRRRMPDPRDWAQAILFRAVALLTGAAIMGAALLLSHSRGAFLATIIALMALLVGVSAARMVRVRAGAATALLALAVLAGMLAIGDDGTAQRLAESAELSPDESRPHLYRGTATAISDAPLLGTGAGAFLPTFRMYRDVHLSPPQIWDFAHNVYLETALDLGLPAALLQGMAFLAAIGVCARGLRTRRRDQVFPAIAIAAWVLVATHGLVDFSPQIPAIAVTLAFLAGIGYAQAWPTADLET